GRAAPFAEPCGHGCEHLGLDQLGWFEWVEHGFCVLLVIEKRQQDPLSPPFPATASAEGAQVNVPPSPARGEGGLRTAIGPAKLAGVLRAANSPPPNWRG